MDTVAMLGQILESNSDPRISRWFLMQSPAPMLLIVVVYLLFCVSIGPWFMKHRQPFQLKNTLIGYNLINVLGSVYILHESLASGWWRDYSFRCQPVDYSDNPKAIRMVTVFWMFNMFKIFELLDTVFFVLRKKYNQVSFLHLYHHASTPLIMWLTVKLVPGGHISFGMPCNAFIHALMYSYYLLAALGPQYHKYLWWKKYLTIMQLIQFVCIVLHLSQLFIFECDYPKLMPSIVMVDVAFICYMFTRFYKQSYSRQTSSAEKKQ